MLKAAHYETPTIHTVRIYAFMIRFNIMPQLYPSLPNRIFQTTILGAFAKFRKATISFVMSVRPSVRMQKLGCHWMDIHEI